jgi:hypothetical protein
VALGTMPFTSVTTDCRAQAMRRYSHEPSASKGSLPRPTLTLERFSQLVGSDRRRWSYFVVAHSDTQANK